MIDDQQADLTIAAGLAAAARLPSLQRRALRLRAQSARWMTNQPEPGTSRQARRLMERWQTKMRGILADLEATETEMKQIAKQLGDAIGQFPSEMQIAIRAEGDDA